MPSLRLRRPWTSMSRRSTPRSRPRDASPLRLARRSAVPVAPAVACPTSLRCRRSWRRRSRSNRSGSASARPRPARRVVATRGWPASPTARSRTWPRRSSSAAHTSAWSGLRVTRRSAIASPRSSAPGSATRRPSRSSSRARRWPTSAASWSPTRRRLVSRRLPRGAAGVPGSSWRASRPSSSTRSPPRTCRTNHARCA